LWHCGAGAKRPEKVRDLAIPERFELLLDDDRQKENGMAKAHNPLQRGCFEVSLS
jgi:hypothetical protein